MPVAGQQGLIDAEGQGAVKRGVLLVRDLRFLPFPDSGGAVDRLAFTAFRLLCCVKEDLHVNVIGILRDRLLELVI